MVIEFLLSNSFSILITNLVRVILFLFSRKFENFRPKF